MKIVAKIGTSIATAAEVLAALHILQTNCDALILRGCAMEHPTAATDRMK